MLSLRRVFLVCACYGFLAACLPVGPGTRQDAGGPPDGGPLGSDGGTASGGSRPDWCPPLPEPADGGAPQDAGAPSALDGGVGGVAGGGPCTQDGDCASGYCTEGVCCENRCPGPCQSCRRPGAEGTCKPLPAYADVEACDGYTCNGRGSCFTACTAQRSCSSLLGHYCDLACAACMPRTIRPCQSDSSCTSGYCSNYEPAPDGGHTGVCCNERCLGPCETCRVFPGDPNEGTCRPLPAHTPASRCGPYTCNGQGRCRSSCESDLDCSSLYLCRAGFCVLR